MNRHEFHTSKLIGTQTNSSNSHTYAPCGLSGLPCYRYLSSRNCPSDGVGARFSSVVGARLDSICWSTSNRRSGKVSQSHWTDRIHIKIEVLIKHTESCVPKVLQLGQRSLRTCVSLSHRHSQRLESSDDSEPTFSLPHNVGTHDSIC